MKLILQFLLFLLPSWGLAQTITDGLMMGKNEFCTGFMYSHERWSHYWEGERKRDNENIGTFTSKSIMWVGSYGLSPKINLIAMLPYMQTSANKGTLHSMEGLQDVSLAAKYNFLTVASEASTFKAFGALTFSTPLSDYSPDFFPFSLGAATTNLSWRLTGNYQLNNGFYVNGSGAYTWRSNTFLDRSSYFTSGKLYLTNEVKMPNVLDYVVSIGYLKGVLQAEAFLTQQNTLGGDDIRRQDMPFVSNRMNFTKAGALLMYYLPMHKNLALRASTSFTLQGRNVAEATTIMGGMLYTFNFSSKKQLNP